MNETKIVCQYEIEHLDYIDLKLDLTIQPMLGDVTLYWDGQNYHHLKATKRHIVKHTDKNILYVTFTKYLNI
jgi:hypothetical protein